MYVRSTGGWLSFRGCFLAFYRCAFHLTAAKWTNYHMYFNAPSILHHDMQCTRFIDTIAIAVYHIIGILNTQTQKLKRKLSMQFSCAWTPSKNIAHINHFVCLTFFFYLSFCYCSFASSVPFSSFLSLSFCFVWARALGVFFLHIHSTYIQYSSFLLSISFFYNSIAILVDNLPVGQCRAPVKFPHNIGLSVSSSSYIQLSVLLIHLLTIKIDRVKYERFFLCECFVFWLYGYWSLHPQLNQWKRSNELIQSNEINKRKCFENGLAMKPGFP